jgi:NAD(P)-dependent dehydrogenase (short-subunit alcohol dehydrogenase family)
MTIQGKICLITGATSGIGQVTALELARQGAQLGLIVRNPQKGEATRQEIIRQTGNESIQIFVADMASQAQIRAVAEPIQQAYPHIDILLNNAGFIAGNRRELSADGWEQTFAVNHMGYFTLTQVLFEMLKAAPEARVINVASEAHRFSNQLDFDNLQLQRGYSAMKAYGLSKLYNILFTKSLAKRLEGTNITTNSLHPGVVATGFASTSSGFFKVLAQLARPMMISAQKGAETSLYLATAAEAAQYNGLYFDKKRPRTPSALAQNPEKAEKLWEVSEALSGLKLI